MTNNSDSDPNFHHIPFVPPNPNLLLPTFASPPGLSPTHNPKKKRTKLAKSEAAAPSTSSPKAAASTTRPKYSKKPDPTAPKITRPCTECGKKFWSWKALFGHMRCHPERQWRGINPPPNHRRQISPTKHQDWVSDMSEDDHDVASCLLMLANSAAPSVATCDVIVHESGCFSLRGARTEHDTLSSSSSPLSSSLGLGYRFECGECKKVFGSHQALGGHRASHKNVKGCFANARSCENVHETFHETRKPENTEDHNKTGTGHHRCNICCRVFSSGQALGGHMRCHWEELQVPNQLLGPTISNNFISTLDLNVTPTRDHNSSSSSSDTSGFSLDLRLGL